MEVDSHRQIVGGALFDTSSANLIVSVNEPSVPDSVYRGIRCHLMRLEDGRYFLFSQFGTSQSRPIGQVAPLSATEAAEWCEARGINSPDLKAFL